MGQVEEHKRLLPDLIDDERFTRIFGMSPDAYGRMLIERNKEPVDMLYRYVIRGEQIPEEQLAKAAQQSHQVQEQMRRFEQLTGKSVYSRFVR